METKLFQKVTYLSEYMTHACRITNCTKMVTSSGGSRLSDKGGGGGGPKTTTGEKEEPQFFFGGGPLDLSLV